MLKIYGPIISRTLRCLWTAEELGCDYERINIDLMKGEHARPPFSEINPLKKVPALVHDDLVLTESAAICTYLADLFPKKELIPEPRTPDRGRYDMWASFIISELEQPLWTVSKHTFALPEKLRVPDILPTAHKEFLRPAAVLAGALAHGPFLVGGRFTVADILAVHTLNWALKAGFELGHDVLEDYRKEHSNRPALRGLLEKI